MIKTLFSLLCIMALVVSCASTENRADNAISGPEPETPVAEGELAGMRHAPGLGYYYPIQRNTDLRNIWFILKKQIARHSNYYLAGYDARPEFEQTAGLFYKDIYTDEYHVGRRFLLFLNGKCLLLVLTKEEISELTSAYEEDQADYIFDVVYKMAHWLFNAGEM
jgi:hypothetical protein